MSIPTALIEEIRTASRTMVREFGFLRATRRRPTIQPPAHALLEIEAGDGVSRTTGAKPC
jgi:hypothetical protein